MILLFFVAPFLTLMALLILFCMNCIDRFYSIPFAFVSLVSFAAFLNGIGGLGIFLYQWIQERLYRKDYIEFINISIIFVQLTFSDFFHFVFNLTVLHVIIILFIFKLNQTFNWN